MNLIDETSYTVEKLQEMFLQDISARERNRLFPRGLTDGMAIELWDFIDAIAKGRSVEIDAVEGLKEQGSQRVNLRVGKDR